VNVFRSAMLFFVLLAATSSSAWADGAKVPVTAAEHQAMAKDYQDKAAAWRKEAAFHREMAAEYKKTAAESPKGPANPWVKKMEKHCYTIVAMVEKLAAAADKAADFHSMRAKEVEGK
jgi:hypothetical protein